MNYFDELTGGQLYCDREFRLEWAAERELVAYPRYRVCVLSDEQRPPESVVREADRSGVAFVSKPSVIVLLCRHRFSQLILQSTTGLVLQLWIWRVGFAV